MLTRVISVPSLVSRIRGGQPVEDREFDSLYPPWVQRASEQHWTPYLVARRAAELLVESGAKKILDVGSGAGKFCLIGSLSTGAVFVGVEQRAGLVEAAEQAARRCGAVGCVFIHGNATTLDWASFDGFYLYNPFYEHVIELGPAIDEPIARSPELYAQYVVATAAKLALLPPGTLVVTYQGFGGPIPPGYRRILRDPAGSTTEYLELWHREATLDTPLPVEEGPVE